jgi:hypothetical protein
MKLTAALLQGKQYRETVKVEHDGQEYEIEIRPLTHREKSVINAIELQGVNLDVNDLRRGTQAATIDASQLSKNRAQADLKMIELGTVDEDWTVETIDQTWEPEWIEKVAQRIAEISGIARDDQSSFRQTREKR